MNIEKLTTENAPLYLDYLRAAIADEPDKMYTTQVDEKAIVRNIPRTTSLLAVENGKVLGRLEYHFYTCLQDGYRMAYVNWVYVSRPHRHRGIAQALFRAFEEECRKHQIDQYYLIQARNPGAAKFYGSFEDAETTDERILQKNL